MALWARAARGIDVHRWQRAGRAGWACTSRSAASSPSTAAPLPFLRLGFAVCNESELETAVRRLARSLALAIRSVTRRERSRVWPRLIAPMSGAAHLREGSGRRRHETDQEVGSSRCCWGWCWCCSGQARPGRSQRPRSRRPPGAPGAPAPIEPAEPSRSPLAGRSTAPRRLPAARRPCRRSRCARSPKPGVPHRLRGRGPAGRRRRELRRRRHRRHDGPGRRLEPAARLGHPACRLASSWATSAMPTTSPAPASPTTTSCFAAASRAPCGCRSRSCAARV